MTTREPLRTSVISIDAVRHVATVLIDGDTATTEVRLLTDVRNGSRVVIEFAQGGAVYCKGMIDLVGWQTYAVDWAATITPPVIGNGLLQGFYRLDGSSCEVVIHLQFGSTSSGGTGFLSFGLPFPSAQPVEDVLAFAKVLTPFDNANYIGWGTINPGATFTTLLMPLTAADNRNFLMRNADASTAPGTGIPQIPGHYPLESGSVLVVRGSYRVG